MGHSRSREQRPSRFCSVQQHYRVTENSTDTQHPPHSFTPSPARCSCSSGQLYALYILHSSRKCCAVDKPPQHRAYLAILFDTHLDATVSRTLVYHQHTHHAVLHTMNSSSSSSRSKRRNGGPSSWTAALLATALMVQQAHAAALAGSNSNGSGRSHHLQSRQYPSDAPSEFCVSHSMSPSTMADRLHSACARTCIRVKIEEAADPGLAPGRSRLCILHTLHHH